MVNCISCSMPLEKVADFPQGDSSKKYCVHCAQEDGSMKNYDQALIGMTAYIASAKGLDEAAAKEAAVAMMAQMPAWKDR